MSTAHDTSRSAKRKSPFKPLLNSGNNLEGAGRHLRQLFSHRNGASSRERADWAAPRARACEEPGSVGGGCAR